MIFFRQCISTIKKKKFVPMLSYLSGGLRYLKNVNSYKFWNVTLEIRDREVSIFPFYPSLSTFSFSPFLPAFLFHLLSCLPFPPSLLTIPPYLLRLPSLPTFLPTFPTNLSFSPSPPCFPFYLSWPSFLPCITLLHSHAQMTDHSIPLRTCCDNSARPQYLPPPPPHLIPSPGNVRVLQ